MLGKHAGYLVIGLQDDLLDRIIDLAGRIFAVVAVLRNLDGDGPEAAVKDMTIVVAGMPAILAVNRADKLEATMYVEGKAGKTFAPPVLFTSTAPFVEDLMLGITDMNALEQADMTIFDSADLDRDAAMSIIAEHTRFGRGTSSIS